MEKASQVYSVVQAFEGITHSAVSVLEGKTEDSVTKLLRVFKEEEKNVEKNHFLLRYISEPEKLKGLLGIGKSDVINIDEALDLFDIVADY